MGASSSNTNYLIDDAESLQAVLLTEEERGAINLLTSKTKVPLDDDLWKVIFDLKEPLANVGTYQLYLATRSYCHRQGLSS